MSNYHIVDSPEHLQQLLSQDLSIVSVLYFRADWAEPCKQMDGVLIELAKRWPAVLFLSIEAEALPDISESFDVDAVPYFILLRGHTLLTKLSGAQPTALANAIQSHSSAPKSTTHTAPIPAQTVYTEAPGDEEETEEQLTQRCQDLMAKDDIVLFMKGDPKTPKCGFSQKMVNLLSKQNIKYSTFDILEDESVRQRLKTLNDWPTFPQLIVKGEFVGGLDVVTEMVESGEFAEMLA